MQLSRQHCPSVAEVLVKIPVLQKQEKSPRMNFSETLIMNITLLILPESRNKHNTNFLTYRFRKNFLFILYNLKHMKRVWPWDYIQHFGHEVQWSLGQVYIQDSPWIQYFYKKFKNIIT